MRLLWAEIMKMTAIFAVILLHVSAPFLVPFARTPEWWIGNIYDSLSRWCVPLFVMVSGALLLAGAGRMPLRKFLLNRVGRILLPFLIWSGIYFIYRIYVKGEDLAFIQFIPMLLTEPLYYHLWFIYMLIVLYLFAPAAGVFLKEAPRKHVWYLITLWFIWASLLPVIDQPLDLQTYFTPDMDDYSPLKLSGYFLLGYMLKDRVVRPGLPLFLMLLVFLGGAAATVIGTYVMSANRGEFHPYFYKYFSITVVTMTISLFLLIKSIFHTRKEITPEGEERIRRHSPEFMQKIGMSVFGVYLAHALILDLLRDGVFGFTIDQTSAFGMALHPALGIPLFAMSVFVFSLVAVFLIRLTPHLRNLIT
ncbi:acyltransferase [Desulfopila inferna]|uniref:acyltransferase n=1 Tax=Desulfopila inferna TaxID=468528 RepID=UPI0019628CC2|nr:acyltransferase family protein [Desulfopila inferna]MBM9604057.1 acyltransferase family protein [Desulfopila inferna]